MKFDNGRMYMPAVMNMVAPKGIAFIVAGFLSVFLLFQLAYRNPTPASSSSTSRWWHQSATTDNILAPIQNKTLGFEKILVLNMPERGDKRDALSLAASLTNLKFDYIDGIRGETIPTKALPKGQEERKMPNNTLGSWRAHMNAIRTMVEENWSSALILEDDADWDVRIHPLLTDFARGSRHLLNQPITQKTHSPYGAGWDLLWLGHCHDTIPEEDPRTFVIENDLSVPTMPNLHLNNPEIMHPWPNHTRVVHIVGEPICTFAYALSFQGAKKVLYALSVKELQGIFDNALSWWCTYHGQESKCIDAHPSYFYQHRAAGGPGKNSDNIPGAPPQEKGETFNIRWSARLNIENLILGKEMADQYPD